MKKFEDNNENITEQLAQLGREVCKQLAYVPPLYCDTGPNLGNIHYGAHLYLSRDQMLLIDKVRRGQ